MKIKSILIVSILLGLFACNKPNDSPTPPPPPPPPPPIVKDSLLGDWQRINTGLSSIQDIWFLDARRGFLCNDKGIYSSIDSGKTWSLIFGNASFFNLYFLNSQIGYAQGNPNIAYTIDGGNTWIKKTTPPGTTMNIFFISPATGFITGITGSYKTTDTGNTWKILSPLLSNGIYFKDQNNGWIEARNMLRTHDGGVSWDTLPLNTTILGDYIHTLQFTDDLNGWLTGTTFLKTTDGGSKWLTSGFSPPNITSDLFFFNTNSGYLSTIKGIYKTTNGGSSWVRVCQLTDGFISQIFFLDEHTGWTSGTDGTFLRLKN